ncbi:MAG: hypothetical protein MZV65_00115 [Chromatiales bacterium]|nr:hypothetical protein [Chromatiales bacterium]
MAGGERYEVSGSGYAPERRDPAGRAAASTPAERPALSRVPAGRAALQRQRAGREGGPLARAGRPHRGRADRRRAQGRPGRRRR